MFSPTFSITQRDAAYREGLALTVDSSRGIGLEIAVGGRARRRGERTARPPQARCPFRDHGYRFPFCRTGLSACPLFGSAVHYHDAAYLVGNGRWRWLTCQHIADVVGDLDAQPAQDVLEVGLGEVPLVHRQACEYWIRGRNYALGSIDGVVPRTVGGDNPE
jgi:hypothetical protein